MPIYEYKCEDCGAHTEAIQKFSDEPLTTCEDCGGRLHKLISNTSFVLKGSGWYADGYSSAAANKSGDSGEKPSGEKPAKSKADTKKSAEKKAPASAS